MDRPIQRRHDADLSGPAASMPEPLAVRVREACRISGIGRSKLYELIGAGEIEIVKVGAITLIPMDSLRSFIESLRGAELP